MTSTTRTAAPTSVTALTRQLLQIDTSNPGRAETPAAELVADHLAGLGVAVQWFEPEPGRCSVVGRIPGQDSTVSALLLHAHLDVVPAIEKDWQRRGAVAVGGWQGSVQRHGCKAVKARQRPGSANSTPTSAWIDA